jgi:hypothetical protein
MKLRNAIVAAGAVTLVAAPAALAHPSTIELTARVCPPSGACTNATLTDQTQYVILEHGYVTVLKESNGAADHGILNLKNLPGGYRSGLATKAEWFTATAGIAVPGSLTGAADTGAQPHATCRGVSALTSGNPTGDANVLEWQGTDPFFNYVPWQATASGLDDKLEVQHWLDVASRVSGAPLSASSTVAQFTAACTGLGGTYTPADAVVTSIASASSGSVADAVAPLNTQIGALSTQIATLTESLRKVSAFSVSFARPTITRRTIAADGIAVTVSGPAGEKARVDVTTTVAASRRLGIPRHLGTVVGAPGAGGAVTLTVRPNKGALALIAAANKGAIPLKAEVTRATAPASTTATIAG